MIRIRIGFAISVLIGAMYAAASLLDSLTHFGLGVALSALSVIGYGMCDFLESRHDDLIAQSRQIVWARRDGEN